MILRSIFIVFIHRKIEVAFKKSVDKPEMKCIMKESFTEKTVDAEITVDVALTESGGG